MSLIVPIKELRNTAKMSELCHNSDQPVYITKNGYGDMVIMSVELYESMTRNKSVQTPLKPASIPRKASAGAVSVPKEDKKSVEEIRQMLIERHLT